MTGSQPRTAAALSVPYASPVDCKLLYTNGDRVLLALRNGTGYADGQWNLPSGKLDAGEMVDAAVCREADEEVGLHLDRAEMRLSVLLHWRNPEGQYRLGVFFHVEAAPDRHGVPVNAEPHKCAAIGWYPMDALPANTVRYTAAGVHLHRHGIPFAAAVWPATDLLGDLP
ncbi:NUDIX domain-containing protein [Dactylosporangium vinaceum]|uniref:NUDIX domain-containing protein n=1 Tax=Dactylosporangium vinaceum TaxID=53362 RepID=A0ABV5M2T1_9ACTN|nr:NUDIX domain-containing protein [Dactylosporangium vinaceum]UAB96356.1 NUDIX domain-containing protein [Dactylosporangium vinaceum]